jgi:hypothetical protein
LKISDAAVSNQNGMMSDNVTVANGTVTIESSSQEIRTSPTPTVAPEIEPDNTPAPVTGTEPGKTNSTRTLEAQDTPASPDSPSKTSSPDIINPRTEQTDILTFNLAGVNDSEKGMIGNFREEKRERILC